jgi:hypothetical protein
MVGQGGGRDGGEGTGDGRRRKEVRKEGPREEGRAMSDDDGMSGGAVRAGSEARQDYGGEDGDGGGDQDAEGDGDGKEAVRQAIERLRRAG